MSGIRRFFLTVLLLQLALFTGTFAKFRVVREWNYVNFTWPIREAYQEALEQRHYVPENNIVAGIKYHKEYYYVTLPRMKPGVPATLTRIPAGISSDTAPLLAPFPSWQMNDASDCAALQNAQNIEIDLLGRMWIIDGGRTETLTPTPGVKCRPKLVLYDLDKMEDILTYTFPEDVASFNGSFLYDIVVDDSEEGYAYIVDNSGRDPGIIVFSLKDRASWKIRHSPSMRADPSAMMFRVNGINVSASLNIAGIALGPKVHQEEGKLVLNDDREVFYSPLSSLHLYSISTSVLKNQKLTAGEYAGQVKDYGVKMSQSVGMVMDNQGVLYYSLLGTDSIARWDSHTSFLMGQKVIARDEKYLEWPNAFAFDDQGNLTILVNRLNRFIYDRLNLNEPNFRLISSNVNGKSYLYDQAYTYDSNVSVSTEVTTLPSTSTTEKPSVLKPGTDQDPYLAPQPEPEPEPQPKAEPEPTSTSTTKTVEASSTLSPKAAEAKSGVSGKAVGVFAVLTALSVFAF